MPFKKGHKSWNKGLTKETDEGIKKSAEKLRVTKKKLIEEGKLNPIKNLGKYSKGIKGKDNPFFGKRHTKKTKDRISQILKKLYQEGKTIPWNRDKTNIYSKETIRKMSIAKIGQKNLKLSEINRENWKNSEYREKMIRILQSEENLRKILKGLLKKPTKPEEIVLKIIKENNFPFTYCGNGSVILGFKNPDFIDCNGQKKVILHHGLWWHLWRLQRNNPNLTREEVEKRDIEHYKKYGFNCCVIWEDELKNSTQVVDKIKEFMEVK